MPRTIVLASASPQRRAILEQLGVAFEVQPADVEELAAGDAVEVARENARRKARAVAAARPDATVLGADTVVALDGRLLPKPRDEAQAREWLERLSDRTHRVVGGLCVADGGTLRERTRVTLVTFRNLDRATIDWYLSSGEWRDRAGGYAIQGRGAALVEGISGDYWNVVGLSVASLLDLLGAGLMGRR